MLWKSLLTVTHYTLGAKEGRGFGMLLAKFQDEFTETWINAGGFWGEVTEFHGWKPGMYGAMIMGPLSGFYLGTIVKIFGFERGLDPAKMAEWAEGGNIGGAMRSVFTSRGTQTGLMTTAYTSVPLPFRILRGWFRGMRAGETIVKMHESPPALTRLFHNWMAKEPKSVFGQIGKGAFGAFSWASGLFRMAGFVTGIDAALSPFAMEDENGKRIEGKRMGLTALSIKVLSWAALFVKGSVKSGTVVESTFSFYREIAKGSKDIAAFRRAISVLKQVGAEGGDMEAYGRVVGKLQKPNAAMANILQRAGDRQLMAEAAALKIGGLTDKVKGFKDGIRNVNQRRAELDDALAKCNAASPAQKAKAETRVKAAMKALSAAMKKASSGRRASGLSSASGACKNAVKRFDRAIPAGKGQLAQEALDAAKTFLSSMTGMFRRAARSLAKFHKQARPERDQVNRELEADGCEARVEMTDVLTNMEGRQKVIGRTEAGKMAEMALGGFLRGVAQLAVINPSGVLTRRNIEDINNPDTEHVKLEKFGGLEIAKAGSAKATLSMW
jgi:hypothetical protein